MQLVSARVLLQNILVLDNFFNKANYDLIFVWLKKHEEYIKKVYDSNWSKSTAN